MSIFEGIMIYVLSWWMLLFMVLPWGAKPPQQPAKGHAASAPANPRIRRKLAITTLLALVPLGAAYLIMSEARAESGIYHAGSNDCAPPADYAPDASVNAGSDGKTPATMESGLDHGQFDQVPTYLDAPASDYVKNPPLNPQFGGGVVQLGVITTDTRTGETAFNGQPIGGRAARPAHCQ